MTSDDSQSCIIRAGQAPDPCEWRAVLLIKEEVNAKTLAITLAWLLHLSRRSRPRLLVWDAVRGIMLLRLML